MPSWIRKKAEPSPSAEEADQVAQPSLVSNPASVAAALGWEARLVNYPAPVTESLAQFAEPALVLGIGNFGAEIIRELHEHLQDIDGLRPNMPGRPTFVHLTMPSVGDNSGLYGSNTLMVKKSIEHKLILLSGQPTVPDAEILKSNESWEWVSSLPLTPNTRTNNRRAAGRVILFNDLSLNDASFVVDTLSTLGRQTNYVRVFVVAGADDPVGAQLVGDLVALIRLLWPNGESVEILAMIAARSVPGLGSNALSNTMLAGTALEISALTSSIKLSWRFPYGGVWNASNDERQLVNGVLFVQAEYPQSIQECQALAWELLISEDAGNRSLVREIAAKVGNLPVHLPGGRYLPTTSLVCVREVTYPLRFVRNMRTLRLMMELIGSGQTIRIERLGHDLRTGTGLTNALEPAREYGLLTWLKAFETLTQADITSLERTLVVARSAYDRELQESAYALRSYINSASSARLIPAEVVDWLDESVQMDILKELRNYTGFTVRDDRSLVFWTTDQKRLVVNPNRANDLEVFLNEIVLPLVRNLVSNAARAEFSSLRSSYFRENQHRSDWAQKYVDWANGFRNLMRVGEYLPAGIRWFHYSTVPFHDDALAMPINDDRRSTDVNHALQTTLFPRAPLSLLQLDRGINAMLLRSNFVFSLQHIVTDLYGWGSNVNVPYNLQAALVFIPAFRCFAKCCANGSLNRDDMSMDGVVFLPFPTYGQSEYDWERILWEFIKRYQTGKLTRYLEDKAARQPAGQPIMPAGSFFAEKLAHAVQIVTGPRRPTYFK